MKYLVFILCVCTFLNACQDYLDRVPEKDIETVETIFEQRSGAEKWEAKVYGYMANLYASLTYNVSFLGADEFVACEYMRNSQWNSTYEYPGFKIAEGLQMSQEPYDNLWSGGQSVSLYQVIRNCNIFIENIDNVYNMQTNEKFLWKAEVKALKAFAYFELVRRYGPIVLVPENLSVDVVDISELQQPRSHVDTCFNAIVRLLDEAIEYLPTSTVRSSDHVAYFCQESALALKARVLLYAASPLFNGNEFYSDFKGKNGEILFSTEKDPEKWRLAAEAADKAIKACEASGKVLYSGLNNQKTKLLNNMNAVEFMMFSRFSNPEFLLEWKAPDDFFYRYCLPSVNENG